MAEYREALLEILREIGVDDDIVDILKPDQPLLRQGVDSVDFPALLMAVGERFGIEISEQDACSLQTLEDLERLLQQN